MLHLMGYKAVSYTHLDVYKRQVIGSMKKSDPRHVHSMVTDYLPGINITYKTDTRTNIRLSASQTVVRPEFRELSNFQFYDFDMGATIAGFAGLMLSLIHI